MEKNKIQLLKIKSEEVKIKKNKKLRANYSSSLPFLLFYLLIFNFSFAAFAQTAAELETVLQAPAVSCAQAAWLVLSSGNNVSVNIETAFAQAASRGWLKKAQPDDPITLGKLSFLIMKAFDLKGGMMYALLPGPRYAYRSMLSRSFIQGTADPAMTVNGERFLVILGKVLSAQEDES